MWAPFLISYAFGRLYYGTVGPWLRQATEKLAGHPQTPAYKPPMTWGFLARDLTMGAVSFVVTSKAFALMNQAAHGAQNLLTTSGGSAGAVADAAAGQTTLQALGRVTGQTLAMTVIGTALDAVFANKVGPAIEHGVDRLTGHKGSATIMTNKDGTVPSNTVHTSPEQFLRNFAHSACASVTYSAVVGMMGPDIARAVGARIAGPLGGLLGAVATALLAGGIVTTEDRMIGTHVADILQDAWRGAQLLLGMPPTRKKEDGDVVPVPGDRVSWALGGVLVPFGTALATHNERHFLSSLTPGPPPQSTKP